MVDLDLVNILLKLITSNKLDEKVHSHCVNILKTLCSDERGRVELFSKDIISELISQIHQSELLFIVHILAKEDQKFANSLSEEHLSVMVPLFIKQISSTNVPMEIRLIILDILSKLTNYSNKARNFVIKIGITPILYELLRNDEYILLTTEIISNLSVNSEAKVILVEQGTLKALLEILHSVYIPQSNEIDLLSQQTLPFQAPTNITVEDKVKLVNNILQTISRLSLYESNRQYLEEVNYLTIFFGILEGSYTNLISLSLKIITNLSYDGHIRNSFDSKQICKLFELLSEQPSLTLPILSLLLVITQDKIEGEILRDFGLMPLLSLLSNPNDLILSQTLHILLNLIHFDICRNIVQSYMDYEVLNELGRNPNIIISSLSLELIDYLGN